MFHFLAEVSNSSSGASAAVGLMLIGFALILYFIPTMVVMANHHTHAAGVFLLNLLLGWTLLGWVAALVWAVSKPVQQTVVINNGSLPTIAK